MQVWLQSEQKMFIRSGKFYLPNLGLATKHKEFEADFGFIAEKVATT
jgi:hypothetical protein